MPPTSSPRLAIFRFSPTLIGVFTLLGTWHGIATLLPAQVRFEAWLSDGTRLTGQVLSQIYNSPDAAILLDQKQLGDGGNPPRGLHCLNVTAGEPLGPWIELSNGDLLPARIIKWVPPDENGSHGAQVIVSLVGSGLANDLASQSFGIRPEAIRRVSANLQAGAALEPGEIRLSDGRQYRARALRFRENGLECLTEKGLVLVEYALLQSAVWPPHDNAPTPQQDALWCQTDVPTGLVRLRMAQGSVITCSSNVIRRARDEERRSEQLCIRPNWTTETLRISPERISGMAWRKPQEIPLTSLPHQAKLLTTAAKRWPPQLHHSVLNNELRCGELAAEWGWGTHSGTQLTCDLPPSARQFSCWVGLDQSTGPGGCAKVKIVRDKPDGPVLWESDFLLGGKPPVRVGPLNVEGCHKLLFIIDEAHDNRPSAADPWDIRDHVNFLWPTLLLSDEKLPQPFDQLDTWIPALTGFQLPAAARDKVRLRPVWCERDWQFALVLTDHDPKAASVLLEQTLPLALNNSLFSVVAGHDGQGARRQVIGVKIDGESVEATINGDLNVGAREGRRREFDNRDWGLGNFVGKKVRLTLEIKPEPNKQEDQSGIIFDKLIFRPLIMNLPANGKPLLPTVFLTSLAAEQLPQDAKWKAGQRSDGQPLVFRGLKFSEGTAIRTNTELTFKVDPAWRSFVAVLGLAHGWQGAGPYEILLDGQPFWKQTTVFDRVSPGMQVNVDIPPGHKLLTIRVKGEDSFGLLGNAGFVTR